MKMIMRCREICCLLAIFGSTLSHAATECMNAGNTQEIVSCFREQQAKAEQALNKTYQRLIPLARNNSEPELVEDLHHAQRLWIDFRKLNCQFYDRKDRARHQIEYQDCMLRMTRERETELRTAADELARR